MREYKLDLNYYTNEPPKPITHEMFNKLIKQRDQYKAERDTLIDDLPWYKAKVSRLKQEKEILHCKLMAQLEVNTELRMSNKKS